MIPPVRTGYGKTRNDNGREFKEAATIRIGYFPDYNLRHINHDGFAMGRAGENR